MEDFQEYLQSEKDTFPKNYVSDEYKNFLDQNEERLDDDFSKEYEFQTNVRGLKSEVYIQHRLRQNLDVKC